jgi:hypothetical protein
MKRDGHPEGAKMSETTTHPSLRELAYRENDGLEVALLWDARHDALTVSVLDTKTGEFFALDAARDKALDVFYHPFSYAASRNAPHTSQLLAA